VLDIWLYIQQQSYRPVSNSRLLGSFGIGFWPKIIRSVTQLFRRPLTRCKHSVHVIVRGYRSSNQQTHLHNLLLDARVDMCWLVSQYHRTSSSPAISLFTGVPRNQSNWKTHKLTCSISMVGRAILASVLNDTSTEATKESSFHYQYLGGEYAYSYAY
jgi:hypothetical protein